MIRLVEVEWLERRLGISNLQVVDPRRTTTYLQGHIKGAINVPVLKAFKSDGGLLPDENLAKWLGSSGINAEATVVLYDDFDGQRGAMAAWLLEYLGHPNVRFLKLPFDKWKASKREIFYRPVDSKPVAFPLSRNIEARASWQDLLGDAPINIVDVRSNEEYSGNLVTDDRAGHIPRALNIPWLDFVDAQELFSPPDRVREMLSDAGLYPDRETIIYCRTGMRAAVAFIALQQLGFTATLYDGSFAEWARRRDLPIEV